MGFFGSLIAVWSAPELGVPPLPFGKLRAIAWVEIIPRLKNTEQSPRSLLSVTVFVRRVFFVSGVNFPGSPSMGTISYQYVPPRVANRSFHANFWIGHRLVSSNFFPAVLSPGNPTIAGRAVAPLPFTSWRR